MPQAETVLGLALGESRIQGALLRHEGPVRTLLAIDEWKNTIPFSNGKAGAGLTAFSDRLGAFFETAGTRPGSVSVAIDSGRAFVLTIPLEDGGSRLERSEHMRWELEQYFPESGPGEFVTDIQPMTDNKIEDWVKTISVSLSRRHAGIVESAATASGAGLRIIDVDHFAADHALRFNYPDVGKKYMALIGIKESRIDVSILRNGVLESYRYHRVTSNQEIVEQIASLSEDQRGLFSISVYGTFLDTDLLTLIRQSSKLPVEALNPLRHIAVADSLRLSDHLTVPSFRFAAAVGVALRQD